MPKVTHLQTNFTAGEISPKLYGRVDVSRYQNGARKMRDTIVQVWGGGKRRDGSLFIKEVKTSAKKTRLIPFIYNDDTSYMLEFGDGYMRVYKDGDHVTTSGVSAYNGATAYSIGDLVTSSGVTYYCKAATTGNAPPNATYWYPQTGSIYEIQTSYTEAMLFDIDYTQGSDTMFMFNDGVYPQRLQRFSDTKWIIGNAPFIETPFEEPGSYPAAQLTPSAATPVGGTCTFTASTGIATSAYVGQFIKINGGIVKITTFTSGTSFAGVIKQELSGTTAAPQDAWSLHAPSWSSTRGYPRTGTLHEQRLVVGGSPTFPMTVWGSTTGAYLDFTMGVNDDDAFSFTLASDQINPIQYITSSRALVVMTSGGEFVVSGGIEKPLGPTNIQSRQRTNYGCARVRPVRIRGSEIFVQRAGRKIRDFSYNVASDDWNAPDISVLSEHMTETGIVDMCWQQEPTSIIWMVRGDGVPVSVTYDKDQDVIGWTMCSGFSGVVESIATIPDATGDQVWMVVKRTINGSTKRYVERFLDGTLTDCCKLDESGTAKTVWTGLSHLEGKTVEVVGDGSYIGQFTVASGQITITRASLIVEIGLPYENRIELLDPEIQTGMGSASGNSMRTSEVTARFFETTGGEVNGQPLVLRRFGSNSGIETPTLFSGIKRIENLGWERGSSDVVFVQDKPMPFHLLSVTRKLTVNDG